MSSKQLKASVDFPTLEACAFKQIEKKQDAMSDSDRMLEAQCLDR
jgi:hypothetical protein